MTFEQAIERLQQDAADIKAATILIKLLASLIPGSREREIISHALDYLKRNRA